MDMRTYTILKKAIYAAILIISCVVLFPEWSFSQDNNTIPNGTDGSELTVPVIDSVTGKPTNLPPNEVNTNFSTVRVGIGYNHDLVTYIQDDVFKQQMDSANINLVPKGKLRDFRILASGSFHTKRELSWKFAYMWDGDKDTWLVRESGLTIGVPELAGHIFIGRTKEGFSLVKVMNGHSPWGMERQMALDPIPIMADGIKWFGFLPKSRIFWNLGYFNDIVSKGQGFSTFQWQYVARVGWMPFYNKEKNNLLHLAAEIQYSKPLDGKFRVKSRPESNPTPFFIDTGTFPAEHSYHIGGEAYYSTKKWLFGSEVMVHTFMDKESGDHHFFGGDIVATYFLTNTVHPYKTVGSIYGFVPVHKGIFHGGWGEWEAVMHLSTFNLNDGSIQGGSFWRLTPMVNWYMSKVFRTEFVYGYGGLDRFHLNGKVQFFQFRFQLTLM